jgi:hypothetical protein
MKTKILISTNFDLDYQNRMRLIDAFEKGGFEVSENIAVNLMLTEIDTKVIDKVDYVVCINENVFFHQAFMNLVQLYINQGKQSFGLSEILYTNHELGCFVAFRNSFFCLSKAMLLNDDWHILTGYQDIESQYILLAKELNVEAFISLKDGVFKKEFVTAKMYENGCWGIETSDKCRSCNDGTGCGRAVGGNLDRTNESMGKA